MRKYSLDHLRNFYKNKKVIVTGHTGFKGTWLSLWLSLLGAKVLGISDNIPTSPSHYKIIKLNKRIISTRCDIRNFKQLRKKIYNFKPNFIFHLAAQSIVKTSYKKPFKTWETNLIGTINLLEVLRNYNYSKLTAILITSDKVYKNVEVNRGYKEEDPLGGEDPYSASKSSADIAINSYLKSFIKKNNSSVLISTARAGNVIGGGDWSPGRLIPDCVKSWSKKNIVSVRSPNSTRPWQHVLEVINGYMTLAYNLSKNKKLHGESFNFGPNLSKRYKVIDVLKQSKVNWESARWKFIKKKLSFKESKLLHLNSAKAKKTLKWNNFLSFKVSIALTIDWYRKFYENKTNMYNNSKNQINYYQTILFRNKL